jgi:hypothetical protein
VSRRIRVPTYRLHKQTGQAVVTLSDGLGRRHDVLLGKYGNAASRSEYARVVAEWEIAGRCLPPEKAGVLSVNEVILRKTPCRCANDSARLFCSRKARSGFAGVG